MFRIINCNVLPTPYPANYTKYFEPGMFAMLTISSSGIKCGPSNGLYASGIIDDIYGEEDDSTGDSRTVTVWPLRPGFKFATDQVEDDIQKMCLTLRKLLYISSNGKLTGEKLFEGSQPVALLLDNGNNGNSPIVRLL